MSAGDFLWKFPHSQTVSPPSYHMSCVMCPMSHVMGHSVLFLFSLFLFPVLDRVVKQVGGRFFYQRGLPCLVFFNPSWIILSFCIEQTQCRQNKIINTEFFSGLQQTKGAKEIFGTFCLVGTFWLAGMFWVATVSLQASTGKQLYLLKWNRKWLMLLM